MKKSYIISIIVEFISIIVFFSQLLFFQKIDIIIVIIAFLNILIIIFNMIEDRDIQEQQKTQREVLFQNIYDKLKNKYRQGIEDEIMSNIKNIGKNVFEELLSMNIFDIGGFDITISNENWEIKIFCGQYEKNITLYDKINKKHYFYQSPNEDIEVRDNFLEYYRRQCRKNGFKIKL